MTLIYACIGANPLVMTVSDILLSRPDSGARPRVALPTQSDPIEFANAGDAIAGTCQKAVIVGRSIFLWADTRVTAELIVTKGAEASRNGDELLDFPAFISSLGLSDKELAEVSVIYIHWDPADNIQVRYHNAIQADAGPPFHFFEGSGVWDFLVDTIVSERASGDAQQPDAAFSTLARIMSTVVSEAMFRSSLDYLYGGWLEIIWLDSKGLRKIPYAIKFWSRDGDRPNLRLPVFFSWYREHDLFVARMDDHSGTANVDVHLMADPLRRGTGLIESPSFEWEPEIVCHVLLSKNSKTFEMYIRTNMEPVFTVSSEGGQPVVEIDQSFLDDMMAGKLKSDPGSHISKASKLDLF